jgi:23S rRNA-/tRNA-specific pseudouridylate synthase
MTTSEFIEPAILAETSQWLVVSKPAGWLTIPGRSVHSSPPILSEWLKKTNPALWVVHRLDLETSGVVLFARTAKDHALANRWFEKRETKKIYHCLCSGIPGVPVLKVQNPVDGSPSLTQIEVKEKYQEGFFARVTPKTGRRHQIRIHLSQKGYPIWGDETYGGKRSILFSTQSMNVSRVALHASQLELPTGEKFEAKFSEDFLSWLDQLRKEGRRV